MIPQLLPTPIGGQHAELLIRWLRTAHTDIPGTFAPGGILRQGRATPGREDSYLFRFPISVLQENEYPLIVNDSRFLPLSSAQQRAVRLEIELPKRIPMM